MENGDILKKNPNCNERDGSSNDFPCSNIRLAWTASNNSNYALKGCIPKQCASGLFFTDIVVETVKGFTFAPRTIEHYLWWIPNLWICRLAAKRLKLIEFNTMKSEKQLIQFFFDHLSEIKPLLMLGYNVRQDLVLVSISLIMVWAPLLAARNNGHKRSKTELMSTNTDFTCFSQRSCKSDADLCLSP